MSPITIYNGRAFYVHQGERHSGELSWDEMLGQIACLTLPQQASRMHGLFGMRTAEEWQAIEEQRQRSIAARPPTTMAECIAHLNDFVKWHCQRGGGMDAPLPIEQQPPSVAGAMRALMALDGFGECEECSHA